MGRKDDDNDQVQARCRPQASGSQTRGSDRRRWQGLPIFRRRPRQFLSLADGIQAARCVGLGEPQDSSQEPCQSDRPEDRREGVASAQDLPSGADAHRLPGHQIQVDVKFLKFDDKDGRTVKRYQFTAIDDATRIRALKIYDRHNQSNAIDFINTVIARFPFRIREVRTDNGHEFQAKFHWHVEDQGIRHAYIKPASPQLNGKVERSHRTDEQEFYQLLTYTDDTDLGAKLSEWERFYNLSRPHGAFNGKAPYEVLRERL